MPIVVSRATGEIISQPELTQADRDRAGGNIWNPSE